MASLMSDLISYGVLHPFLPSGEGAPLPAWGTGHCFSFEEPSLRLFELDFPRCLPGLGPSGHHRC